jgi:hypothetical protein
VAIREKRKVPITEGVSEWGEYYNSKNEETKEVYEGID